MANWVLERETNALWISFKFQNWAFSPYKQFCWWKSQTDLKKIRSLHPIFATITSKKWPKSHFNQNYFTPPCMYARQFLSMDAFIVSPNMEVNWVPGMRDTRWVILKSHFTHFVRAWQLLRTSLCPPTQFCSGQRENAASSYWSPLFPPCLLSAEGLKGLSLKWGNAMQQYLGMCWPAPPRVYKSPLKSEPRAHSHRQSQTSNNDEGSWSCSTHCWLCSGQHSDVSATGPDFDQPTVSGPVCGR